tara:strand:+ start:688 stop:4473 length:3786 start_codon:yes stop_codon:yes gene_type:complete
VVEKYDRFKIQEPETETNLAVSVAAGIGSGLIKVPLGLVSVAAELYDATQGEGVNYDESAVARLEKFIDDSVVGDVINGLEDKARDTAAGRITEALVQVGVPAARAAKLAGNIAVKVVGGIQKGKRVSVTGKQGKNLLKGAQKANELNKAARYSKYAATSLGGAAGAAAVYDIEDIGTFGDIAPGIGTGLDRDATKDTEDDAVRRLENRAKFFAEGVLLTPFVYGIGQGAKFLGKKGKELAYSNSKFERILDKFASTFRPRSKKSQELFEASMRVEGQEGAAAIIAKDLVKDIDDSFKNIFDKSFTAAERVKNTDTILEQMDGLIRTGKDTIRNNEVVFKNFDKKRLTDFRKSLSNLKIPETKQDELVAAVTNSKKAFNRLQTDLLQGGNLTTTNKDELLDFFSQRLNSTLSNDYKIFQNNKVFKTTNYIPADEKRQAVAQVFMNYAKSNKVKGYTEKDALLDVDRVLENVKMDPVTKSPVFKFESKSALYDGVVQEINISKMISTNKFDPQDLITGQKDLKAFRELFGEIKDARRTIINNMQSMASITARDKFYNTIVQSGKIVFDNPTQAQLNLPNRPSYTLSRNGMQIKSPLGEEIYTNPMNGKFTSSEFEQAIKFAEEMPLDGLMKSSLYRYLIAVPKAGAQVAKTVLSPFTHMRNFTSAVAFSAGTGNLFKDPRFILRSFKQSFNTIQPQIAYRNLPEDQAFYRFLLDEGVVNSSSTFQDVQGLLKDIAKGGDFVERAFGKLGKRMNKVFRGAQDLYVAEDDFYKIYNYLAEFDNLKNAYKGAVPDIELAKRAASIVRNTVPNYAYVSDFIKGLRRSPLGNFVSFPAEIVRTTFNITEQGLKELADPALRSIGARRLIGLGTTLAIIPPTVVEAFRGIYGITRDELAAMRNFLPEWSRESTIIPSKDKDGNYYYTDFSHGFAYDTVVNPIQSVIANVEAGKEQPLIQGMIRGTTRALGRFLDPFISESIWVQALNDLYSRGGRTDTGSEVWNPRDPEGDKMAKGIRHLVEALAPLSLPQISRTIKAGIYGEDPETGRDLSLTGELGGFFGFRNQKMDFEESLGYKISDYNGALRDSRKFLPRPRGNVNSKDIIKELIKGNASWFEAQKDMKQSIEAMKTLGYSDIEIGTIFDRRGKGKDFNALRVNQFTPFDIPDGLVDEYIRNARENGYKIPLTASEFNQINIILRQLDRLKLNQPFPLDLIREFTIGSAPPLPNMPMPNVNTVNTTQAVDPRTNLTRTETALLSPEEQVIASRT